MGRRSRRAIPVRHIHLAIGSQIMSVELGNREQLRDRSSAQQLVRRLKTMADEIIASLAQMGRSVEPPRAAFFQPRLSCQTLSLDHFPIFALEVANSRCGVETSTSCVSFIEGIFVDDSQTPPARVIS
jgi:hypothetical protein